MRRGSRLEGPQIVAGASHPHPDGKEDPIEYAALHIKVREYYQPLAVLEELLLEEKIVGLCLANYLVILMV